MLTSKTGADVIVDSFIRNEIGRLFLFPGGTIAPILDVAVQRGIQLVCSRHEQGAGYAALGAAPGAGRTDSCAANRRSNARDRGANRAQARHRQSAHPVGADPSSARSLGRIQAPAARSSRDKILAGRHGEAILLFCVAHFGTTDESCPLHPLWWPG